MLDWLDRQRQKPKEARRRVAFLIAVVATVVVLLFWVVSLPARFSGLENTGDREQSEEREMFDGFNTLLEEGRNELRNTARELEEASATDTASVETDEEIGAEAGRSLDSQTNESADSQTTPQTNEPDAPVEPSESERTSAFDTATVTPASP